MFISSTLFIELRFSGDLRQEISAKCQDEVRVDERLPLHFVGCDEFKRLHLEKNRPTLSTEETEDQTHGD